MSLVAVNFQPIKGSTEKSPEEAAGPKTSNAGRKERPQPAVVKDPDAIRTLIISNLPPDGLTNASLWKKIRKYTGAEKVQWPLGEDSSKGIVTYCTIIKTRIIQHMFILSSGSVRYSVECSRGSTPPTRTRLQRLDSLSRPQKTGGLVIQTTREGSRLVFNEQSEA